MSAVYEAVLPYLSDESKAIIETEGKYVFDSEFGWVTPTIGNGMCAYGIVDKNGIVKCAIEKAYNEGKISWKKPISCHLFPVRIKKTRKGDLVNYEPRQGLCDPACALGKKLKVPVYQFLKEALVRKYGQEFYDALEATATHINNQNNSI